MTPHLCIKSTKNPGDVLPEKWGVVCGTLAETLTLFHTKICDFPYPISDLIKNLIPYSSPEARRVTSCYGTYTVGAKKKKKREMVLLPSEKYPIQD